jgi:uncharacterized membrane protein YdjX (TVP38/TMEM64 family)
MRSPSRPRAAAARVLAAVALVAAVAVLAHAGGLLRLPGVPGLANSPDLGGVRRWVDGWGPVAPVVYLVLYALIVLAPIPKSVFTAAAGLAFGIPVGLGVVIVGATLGALGAFLVGRGLGRDAVARYAGACLDRLDAAIERHGVLAALVVRLVPVLPFTLLNYACGVTAMRLRHYAVATVIGLLPGTTALVALGGAGVALPPGVLAAISIGLGTTALAVSWWRHRRPARSTRPALSTSPSP